MVAALVRWSYEDLARRLFNCLVLQGLPDFSEGGAMTVAHLWLASVLLVVDKLSTDLDIISIVLGVRCTAMIEDK